MAEREVRIPEGVRVEVVGKKLRFSGPKGEVEKDLSHMLTLSTEVLGDKLRFSTPSSRRKDEALVGTAAAHARNAIVGVTQGYTYTLRIVFSHFPIKVSVEGNEFLIHNFLGERVPRVASIVPGVKINIKGSDVLVSGVDKDAVALTAARIEQACRIKKKDRRIFQDGIYIVKKEVGMK
jgi:large subunit ribosomal protein L6